MDETMQASEEIIEERITLWQDHSHPCGYRPQLNLIKLRDGKFALELKVFGNVTIIPYVKAECGHD